MEIKRKRKEKYINKKYNPPPQKSVKKIIKTTCELEPE